MRTYLCSSALAVALSTQLALAAEGCEERYNELNQNYNLAFTKLAEECWPTFESEAQALSFDLSPECVEKSNALNAEWSDRYTALSSECQQTVSPELAPVSQPTESLSGFSAPNDVALPILSKKCEERFTAINDRFSAAYVNLDADCYPADSSAWCGFQLSPECFERYDLLSKESSEVYNAYYQECYGPGWNEFFGISDSSNSSSVEKTQSEAKASTAQVVAAPTKKEMLKTIKSLKKQLRRAKAKSKKMRAQCKK
jgi:hypothetical protein